MQQSHLAVHFVEYEIQVKPGSERGQIHIVLFPFVVHFALQIHDDIL